MSIDWKKLSEPFHERDVEWRIQEAGKGQKDVWAKVIPYITARAIQQRLDEVVGPQNWRNEFHPGPAGGVLCGISIRVGDEWITKFDGADVTGIEAVKGAYSGATKRAAVQWGIGRYLYHLEAYFAQIVQKGGDALYARLPKDKGGDVFYWLPPRLPLDALPEDERRKHMGEPAAPAPTNNGNGSAKKTNGRAKQTTKPADNGDDLQPTEHGKAALAALNQVDDPKRYSTFKKTIHQRIENGDFYAADDVKLLERKMAEVDKRLGVGQPKESADAPDKQWLIAAAISQGCPNESAGDYADFAVHQDDPAAYIKSKPWTREPANA